MLTANIAIGVASVNVTFGAYITGIFGMNLDNTTYIQPVTGVFATVFFGTITFMTIATFVVYYYLVYTGVVQEDDLEEEQKLLEH